MKIIVAQNPLGVDAPSGSIILWFGTKANIPPGWVYYSTAAGYWVMGTTSASTYPLGDTNHTHDYSNDTGLEGGHTHAFGLTLSQPTNATLPGLFYGGNTTNNAAGRYHTNHTVSGSINVSTDPDHDHAILDTGSASALPLSKGLYYIKRS